MHVEVEQNVEGQRMNQKSGLPYDSVYSMVWYGMGVGILLAALLIHAALIIVI